MLRNRTLFVVGAGASSEFGLPLGVKLADQIAKKLHFKFDYNLVEGDSEFLNALRQKFQEAEVVNSYLRACARIKTGIGLARSIDNYIDTHKEDLEVALVGKLAIVDCIAKAEKSCTLYFDPNSTIRNFDLGVLGKTWIAELVDILFQGVPKSNVVSVFDNLSIISFNYDRCIQQALVLALHTLYHLDFSQCYELVSALQIIYPYGGLGTLSSANNTNNIPFGADIYQPYLFNLSKNIRTYSEQVADAELVRQISAEVTRAENIVFLGCAYHSQNLSMLRSRSIELTKNIFGTAIGISDNGVEQKKSSLMQNIYGQELNESLVKQFDEQFMALQKIRIHNKFGCFELMKEYRESLMK